MKGFALKGKAVIIIKSCIIACVFLFACANNQNDFTELIVTNRQEVMIIRLTDTIYQKVWSWNQEDTGLPDSLFNVFYAIDECKPVNNGKQILITASWKG